MKRASKSRIARALHKAHQDEIYMINEVFCDSNLKPTIKNYVYSKVDKLVAYRFAKKVYRKGENNTNY